MGEVFTSVLFSGVSMSIPHTDWMCYAYCMYIGRYSNVSERELVHKYLQSIYKSIASQKYRLTENRKEFI